MRKPIILYISLLSLILLLYSCASVPSPPVQWETVQMSELDFRNYYDNNILDPIEGIWTVSENTNWMNVTSGIRGNNNAASIYRIAVIKDEIALDGYKGFILESRRTGWSPGRLKVKYRKTGYEMAYEEYWYMANYTQDIRNILIEDEGLIRSTKTTANYPFNYEIETIRLKVYPAISGASKSKLSSNVTSTGSGFLVSENGLVITNYHVIENAENIEIYFPNKNITKHASLKLKDINNDLAILEIDEFEFDKISNNHIPYNLADIRDVKVGQEVFTLGFPLGSIMGTKSRLSTGRINSIYGIQEDPRLFQIGNPLQPGNSGGPLFNIKGELVGIVVSGLNAKYFYDNIGIIPQNVNFAVKVSYLNNLIGMIPEDEEISRRKSSISNLSLENQVELLNPFIVQIKVY
jgi:S1-C subfamily serine protease